MAIAGNNAGAGNEAIAGNDAGAGTGGDDRRSGTRRPTVVVIAPGRLRGERYLARRHGAADVILVTGVGDLAASGLRLGRRDRVEWLSGWCRGPEGDRFAAALERYAQAGGFGGARHVFDVAACGTPPGPVCRGRPGATPARRGHQEMSTITEG